MSRVQETAPEAELETGAVVPLALVKIAVAVIVAVMVILASVVEWPGHGAVWVGGPLIGLTVMWRPWGALPALAGGLAGAIVLVGGAAPLPAVMALVLLVHLTLVTAAFAGRGSWGAAVEARVLTDAARPFLVVQAGAQVLAVLALQVSGAALGPGDLWRAVALLGAIGVALLVLPSRPRGG
jgi:hypothetical protein